MRRLQANAISPVSRVPTSVLEMPTISFVRQTTSAISRASTAAKSSTPSPTATNTKLLPSVPNVYQVCLHLVTDLARQVYMIAQLWTPIHWNSMNGVNAKVQPHS